MVRVRRIKVQIEYDDGSRHSVVFDGNFDKNKLLRMIEVAEFINGSDTNLNTPHELSSVGEKIWNIIDTYPSNEFTSSDILELYEDRYNEPIKLSVISTYLSRFTNRNLLSRIKGKNEWLYRKERIRQHLS
ncbi:MAG: hypothetical protein QW416_02015 [Candidatus Nitrosocaldaceae archaeon]